MGAGSCRKRRSRRLRGLLTLAALVCSGFAAKGQEGPIQQSAARPEASRFMFSPRAGVNIAVSAEGQALSRAEVAQALEQVARQLRTEASCTPASPLLPSAPVQAAGKNEVNVVPAAQPHLPEASVPVGDGLVSSECQSLFGCYMLPATLLWQPPLASQWAPRNFAKATTLSNANTNNTINTALGGTMGLLRYGSADQPTEGIQTDIFGVILSRFALPGEAVAMDYRAGLIVTFGNGPWSGKIGYEHTSAHVGDELMDRTGRKHAGSLRDEFALGLAYRFLEQFRVYGQTAYAFGIANPNANLRRDRWDVGLEWASPLATGWSGRPFAAADVEFRGDQNYGANLTTQIGLMWRAEDYGRSIRLALEYYNGQSPFGQFVTDKERWLGVSLLFDF
jgi:hypothetical protein